MKVICVKKQTLQPAQNQKGSRYQVRIINFDCVFVDAFILNQVGNAFIVLFSRTQ